MAKHIDQEFYLTGNNEYLKVSDTFIYEFNVYYVFLDRVELADCKLYSSKEPLNIKKDSVWIDKKDYKIFKCIDWKSAPEQYMINKQFKKVLK